MYEQILKQLQDTEFENEVDANGNDAENSYLRRLYRVLNVPTGDWRSIRDIAAEQEQGCCNRFRVWMRLKFGLGDGEKSDGAIGFKPIRQKSLHFESSRFRESLMEISMMTQENSLSDFVAN